MSLLTTIGGIPLFSTQEEALQWGATIGLQGIHTHIYGGQTGYMGGSSHSQATSQATNQTPSPTTNQTTNTPESNNSSGNIGGY